MSRTYPSTYEAPVFRLLKYALIIFLSGIFTGIIITVVGYRTNWWQQLAITTLNFHLVHPWFFLLYGGFGTVAILYYRFERNKRKEQETRRKFLEDHVLQSLKEEAKNK